MEEIKLYICPNYNCRREQESKEDVYEDSCVECCERHSSYSDLSCYISGLLESWDHSLYTENFEEEFIYDLITLLERRGLIWDEYTPKFTYEDMLEISKKYEIE